MIVPRRPCQRIGRRRLLCTAKCSPFDALKLPLATCIRRKWFADSAISTQVGLKFWNKILHNLMLKILGQEAVAVGMKASMRPQDNIISAYRVHGWTHLMNVTIPGVLCELTGRKTGCARGKGGSMHMYSPNFYGKIIPWLTFNFFKTH